MTEGYRASAEPRPPTQSPARSRHRAATSNLPPELPLSSSSYNIIPNASMLSASSSNNHSLFSFGRNGDKSQSAGQSTASYDFLPSVSFDDLHTSLESEFTLTQFPPPTGTGPGKAVESQTVAEQGGAHDTPDSLHTSDSMVRTAPPSTSNRPSRSGSLLRRPSTSSRQPSISSMNSTSSVHLDSPSSAARSRRQSNYPPVSNTATSKPPRKSIGPGVFGEPVNDGMPSHQRRRPSLMTDRGSDHPARVSMIDTSVLSSDSNRYMTSSRAAKAKSVQPPPRTSQTNISLNDTLSPEQHRLSTIVSRSPRAGGGRGSTPSSSSKRASMMPGGHQGAHGLGARTVSPTEIRRAKRMSIMPTSQSLSQLSNLPPPPPPVSMDTRAESRSPSMIPRKLSGTPNSARTTPDVNRKSYSSGLSIASNFSYNTVRTSTGSIQARIPQSASTSRLPAPKHPTVHNPTAQDDEGEVPPVPAIPKVYGSPKGSPGEPFFLERKRSGLGTELASIHSQSTGSLSLPAHPEPAKPQQRKMTSNYHSAGNRKSSYIPDTKNPDEALGSHTNRKSLQPLSLPPMSLGPLNIPHLSKGMPFQENGAIDGDLSPPPSRLLRKTPSTPMTASRSTFFSKSRFDEGTQLASYRSSSSINITNELSPTPPDASISDLSFVMKEASNKPSMSPFLSSSAPKGGFDPDFLKNSKVISEDSANVTAPVLDVRTPQKPSGPRAPTSEHQVPKSPILEEPPTPSSISSLRRKLSLSWKRGFPRDSTGAPSENADKATKQQQQTAHSRQDSMPPPRIPISATMGGLSNTKGSSPSPSVKSNGGYLESRRRKSSGASLANFVSHDRTKSDTWSSTKDIPDSSTMPTTRNTSVMQKLLKAKASSSTVRNLESWTAELDKDDLAAEDEMRKLGSRRKETEIAAKTLDQLRKRATPKQRVGARDAIGAAMLNIYERGEIVDYSDVYFCGTQNARKVVGDLHSDLPNFGYDDDRGDYSIVPGDHLAYRYEIVDVLGKGSFGQVVRCVDHKLGVLVAVKIIRNKKRFHQQALVEVNILQKLREWDPQNKHSMVNFTQSFYFRGHLCISTELLDMNLYEFIKLHQFRGFSLRIVRRFTKQILSSLNLLKQKKVIHCDLKPENILLRHPLHAEIKVIDFGSSCFEDEKVYTYIQSRFYRSPEVILGMTYGLPIDMWSVGCILAELFTGVPIFPGENEQEQLACIMEVFGPPEKHLIEKSTRRKLFFDSMGKPRLTVSSKGRRRRPSSKTLQQVLKSDDEAFLDFITRCLRWDPDRRLKPEDAIRHEFITGKKMPPPSQRSAREASPIKRHNTISVPRPLPDVPMMNKFTSTRVGASPHKVVSGLSSGSSRRASGATAPTTASTMKRTSTSNSSSNVAPSGSGLPRAAGRSASGKQDLASAGASVAMSRRG